MCCYSVKRNSSGFFGCRKRITTEYNPKQTGVQMIQKSTRTCRKASKTTTKVKDSHSQVVLKNQISKLANFFSRT